MREGFNDPNTTHQLFSSRIKIPATEYIGDQGRIFYHEDTGELRISDGITPHGKPIYVPGLGGGGTGTNLVLYSENGAPSIGPSASGLNAIALGDSAVALIPGSIMQANGAFTTAGDAQIGSYVARAVTTNGGFTEMFLNGTTHRITLPQNSSIAFTVTIIARRTDSGMEGAVYEMRGGIDRAIMADTTSLVGVTSKTVVVEDNPVWDIDVNADTTNGALRILVKGEAGKTIRWVAHIQTVEVRN